MNKICVTITAQNSTQMLDKLAELEKDHDFFELRLDALDDLSSEATKRVINSANASVIATVRTKAEGGNFAGNDDEYARLIEACFASKADYVDVELAILDKNSALPKIIEPKRTIISYHNFTQTPSDAELKKILEQMESVAPEAIRKIACSANSMGDVVRLTELQKSQPKDKAIIIAMGESGQVLRLLGPSLGAFTSFASTDNSPAAPGQMYYREMKKVLDLMENR